MQARTALEETENDKGEFKRKDATFRKWIGKDKDFPAEGRYQRIAPGPSFMT